MAKKKTKKIAEVDQELNLESFIDSNNEDNGVKNGFRIWYIIIEKKSALERFKIDYWKKQMKNFLKHKV